MISSQDNTRDAVSTSHFNNNDEEAKEARPVSKPKAQPSRLPVPGISRSRKRNGSQSLSKHQIGSRPVAPGSFREASSIPAENSPKLEDQVLLPITHRGSIQTQQFSQSQSSEEPATSNDSQTASAQSSSQVAQRESEEERSRDGEPEPIYTETPVALLKTESPEKLQDSQHKGLLKVMKSSTQTGDHRTKSPTKIALYKGTPIRQQSIKDRKPQRASKIHDSRSGDSVDMGSKMMRASFHQRLRSLNDSSDATSSTNRDSNSQEPLSSEAPSFETQKHDAHILRRSSQRQNTRTVRPAFSTMQQNFSPRKAPKAVTASITRPSPGSTVQPDVVSAETCRLQTELLQLSVLHETGQRALKSWRASAEKRLAISFEAIASLGQEIQDLETDEQRRQNLLALHEWAEADEIGGAFEERLQSLGSLLREVQKITSPDSRYEVYVAEFQNWVESVDRVWETRKNGLVAEKTSPLINCNRQKWADEALILGQKLSLCARKLNEIGRARDGSTLQQIVESCRVCIEGIAAELSAMMQIERQIIKSEESWVETEAAKLLTSDVTDLESKSTRLGRWMTTTKLQGTHS